MKKKDKTVIKDCDSLEMIKRPNLWPAGFKLPLKRYGTPGDFPELGLLFEKTVLGKTKYVVFLTNLWDQDYKNAKRVNYENAEAVLADGWVVD